MNEAWQFQTIANEILYLLIYKGPYEEYKKNDPYYMDVFDHSSMKVEFWKDMDRDLWIEEES